MKDETLRIGTVMTAFPLTVDVNAPVDVAQEMMTRHGIRHLPVTRDGELVSIITERDISLAVLVNRGLRIGETLVVDDVCAINLYAVDVAMPVRKVVAEMAKRKIGSAVVTKRGKLAGIFTAVDACRVLAEKLEQEEGAEN